VVPFIALRYGENLLAIPLIGLMVTFGARGSGARGVAPPLTRPGTGVPGGEKEWCHQSGGPGWRVVNRWVRAWGVVWLMAAGLLAAPLLDEPVATLALKDNTVLHDARAKGFLTKVVLVQNQDGVRTVPYELFPEEFQAALALKRQAVLAEVVWRASFQQIPPPPSSTSPAGILKTDWRQFCRVTLAGGTGHVLRLQVENLSDYIVSLYPWQVVARTQAGTSAEGAHWVGLNEEGRVVMTLRSRQQVDARATVTLAVTVSPDLEAGSVASVAWR